ncbi:hypothetical protein [Burkholderia pseudomallei]|uniref:hypothetical protein n=1 Tax=Burkholderia pseudomallei TaxID=28450 RepID=UPI000A19FFE6|nr:hypothetical protein [Burkholderia pseudomallei]ARK86100.1 hypothetical protein BOC42_00625 [Burkholderia pseudomallei]
MGKTLTVQQIEKFAREHLYVGDDDVVFGTENFARAIEREVIATQQPEPRDEEGDWNTPCAGCSTPRACQYDGCRSESRDEVTDERIAAMFERVTGYSLDNGRAALNDADILGFARELLEAARTGASHE